MRLPATRPVGTALRSWRSFYGHHPLHLLVILGLAALVGYVVSRVYDDPSGWWLLVWFAGALLGHDLVLFPLYALLDRVLQVGRRLRLRPGHRVPVVNHVRVPLLGAGVLGLIFLPTITRHGEPAFTATSTRTMAGYFQVWLVITAVLCGISAVLYLVRVVAARRAPRVHAGDDVSRVGRS